MDTVPADSPASAQIEHVEQSGSLVSVFWADGSSNTFHSIWLRDNCRCEKCGEPVIGRRTSRLTDFPLDIAPTAVGVDTQTTLSVTWNHDRHESRYDATWLRATAYDTESARKARRYPPILWDNAFLKAPPTVDFSHAGTDRGLFDVLRTVRDYGICFITGGPSTTGQLEGFATRFGHIQETNFGRIQDLKIDPSKRSIANSFEALPLHTDEPYRASPPGILMFHCVQVDPERGGQSQFLDGFKIASILRDEDPEGFNALVENRQSWRRHFEGDVDVSAQFPMISLDEFGDVTGIRFNDRVASPLSLPPDRVETYYRGYRRLIELTSDPDYVIARRLQPGDIAIFDNHRILHGRSAFALQSERHLQWGSVRRGDLYSSLRILADKLGIDREDGVMPSGAY